MVTTATKLDHLPEDALLTICDFIQPDALLSLSYLSTFWNQFCINKVWPRRVAAALGVRALHLQAAKPNSSAWLRLYNTFVSNRVAAHLSICVQIGPDDTATSLALRYAVSPHDIFRTNSLFTEHQLASRTHLYVPLLSEDAVIQFTGLPSCGHTPVLVRDKYLSRKCFLVVKFASSQLAYSTTPTISRLRAHSYVRKLVVKLIARGLSVHEDEVRFYLQDSDFDVAKAYKQLLADHQFAR